MYRTHVTWRLLLLVLQPCMPPLHSACCNCATYGWSEAACSMPLLMCLDKLVLTGLLVAIRISGHGMPHLPWRSAQADSTSSSRHIIRQCACKSWSLGCQALPYMAVFAITRTSCCCHNSYSLMPAQLLRLTLRTRYARDSVNPML